MHGKILVVLSLVILLFSGCLKNDDAEKQKQEQNNLMYYINYVLPSKLNTWKNNGLYPYLDENIINAKDSLNHSEGYYYVRLDTTFTGTQVKKRTFIFANVTGGLINDTVLETNDHLLASKIGILPSNYLSGPLYLQVDSLPITGLRKGVLHMKEGNTFRFVIPSDLAFGSGYYTSIIPIYSTIFFDIKVLKIIADPVKFDSAILFHWVDSLNMTTLDTGVSRVFYKINTENSTDTTKLQVGQKIQVVYKGKILDGNKYFTDSTHFDTITFTLGQHRVINGWETALKNFKNNSSAEIIIPYKMAYKYGLRNSYGQILIPEYHSLYFEFQNIIKTE